MTTDLVETKTVTDTESESLLDEKQQTGEQAVPDQSRDETAQSPGERLQQARLLKGLTIEQVGEELKIPASYIDAIDHSQFDKLPGLMFARGYIRSYARMVDLDADELIGSFDQFTGDNRQDTPRLSEGRDVEIRRQVSPVVSIGGAVSVVCILLVVAFSYYNWGGGQDSSASSETADEHSLHESEVAQAPVGVAENAVDPEKLEPVSESVVNSSASEETYPSDYPETLPAEAVDDEANAAEPETADAEAAEVEPVAPIEPLVAEEPRLMVRFSQDCWVQVRDMEGRNLFTDVQKAGSSLDLEVPSVIQVRFGNVTGVQSVTFNGEPVEVTPSQPGRKVVSLVLGSEDAG